MRVVTDVEHHKMGDGLDIEEVQMGQPLRVEFSLQPETGMAKWMYATTMADPLGIHARQMPTASWFATALCVT